MAQHTCNGSGSSGLAPVLCVVLELNLLLESWRNTGPGRVVVREGGLTARLIAHPVHQHFQVAECQPFELLALRLVQVLLDELLRQQTLLSARSRVGQRVECDYGRLDIPRILQLAPVGQVAEALAAITGAGALTTTRMAVVALLSATAALTEIARLVTSAIAALTRSNVPKQGRNRAQTEQM